VNLKVVLVDAVLQEAKIKNGDPSILMKRVIEDGQDVPQKQIDDATERAVKTGCSHFRKLFLTKSRNRAFGQLPCVRRLCGYGNVLVSRESEKSGRSQDLRGLGFVNS